MSRRPDLLELTDLIYQAAADVHAWPAAMCTIADALGAHQTSLTISDPRGGIRPLVFGPRTDPEWMDVFIERWAQRNLAREKGCAFPLGQVYQFDDLPMRRSAFDQTSFYNEFWAPQRMNVGLLVNIAKEQSAIGILGFYRSSTEGRFDGDDERLLEALGPRLQSAVALNLRFAHIEMERHSAAEMLNRSKEGTLLVDADARILFANAQAEALLKTGVPLSVTEGRLAACSLTKTAALRSMIAAGDTAGDLMTLSRPDGRGLAVLVVPLKSEITWLPRRPAAIVFVTDPNASVLPSRERIRLLFNLTPAQAALAREILWGDGIQAAAQRLHISRATARTHRQCPNLKDGPARDRFPFCMPFRPVRAFP